MTYECKGGLTTVAVAYLGGPLGDAPPLGLNTKIFWTHWTKKILFKFLGRAVPPPQTPSSVGRGHALPAVHPIGASGASNLTSLALAPFHKILNTPLHSGMGPHRQGPPVWMHFGSGVRFYTIRLLWLWTYAAWFAEFIVNDEKMYWMRHLQFMMIWSNISALYGDGAVAPTGLAWASHKRNPTVYT